MKSIKTDIQQAPESRLKFGDYKCKLISKNVCRKNLCWCRKHGLKCMAACGECREPLRNFVDIIQEDYDEDMFEKNLFDLFD